MIYSAQIRAARGLLGWSQNELANATELGLSTIKRMEASAGLVQGNGGNIWRLQQVLEGAGIVFILAGAEGGPGVRLAKSPE
ncbi:MAG: helix-turn-helix domain-containing protein [Parvibaculaceae bacterium]